MYLLELLGVDELRFGLEDRRLVSLSVRNLSLATSLGLFLKKNKMRDGLKIIK